MRPASAPLLLLALAGCSASSECPGLRVPSGVAQGAARLRLEVYDAAAASCAAGRFSLHGTDSPQVFTFSDLRGRLTVDLSPGDKVIRLRAYGDSAETRLIGEGCDAASVSAGGASCLDLEVAPVPVTGADAAPPGDGPAQADLADPCQHFDGVTAFRDCNTDYSYSSAGAQNMCERFYSPVPEKPDCFPMNCPGNVKGSAWCTKAGGASCRCWAWLGDGIIGHVGEVTMGGSCLCPSGKDPTWY